MTLDVNTENSNCLSIITASHDNFNGLYHIYESINSILCENINWIIQDSGICKKTESFFKNCNSKFISFDNSGDRGIYDALNIALKRSLSFYLVVGSDDNICPTSLVEIAKHIRNLDAHVDIICCSVYFDDLFTKPSSWFFNPFISVQGWVSSHSVGTIIRKDLHHTYGNYDLRFPILADSHFLTKCYLGNVKRIIFPKIILGTFNSGGVSTTQHKKRISEAYDYHTNLGYNKIVQLMLYLLRKTKYFFRRNS